MQPHHNTLTTESRICEWCGTEFLFNPKTGGKGRFCCRDCGRKGQSKRVTVICQHCQRPFEAKQHVLAKGEGKFCSNICKGNNVIPQTPEQRFWKKVEKTDSCWLWTGGSDCNGYGRMGVGRSDEGTILAHRFSYELHRGPIAGNLFVCHRCDNPQCVNPNHLFLGTALDNVQDMIAKSRNAHGEKAPWSKLTETQVTEIRQRYAAGGITQKALAKEYGLIQTTVGEIVRRVIWKHVP